MKMMISRRGFIQTGLVATASLALPHWAYGQNNWPNRAIRLVVSYASGGATDVIARILSEGYKKYFNQPFIVENRSGAGGSIGTASVAQAAPDGYTFTIGLTSSLLINQFQYKHLPYQLRTDLMRVSLLATAPLYICVPASLPIHTVNELFDYIKAHRSKVAYGTFGNGTYPHMFLEHISKTLGADMTHIPYRGETAILQALMTEEIQIGVSSGGGASAQTRAGVIRAIGVTGLERMSVLPEVPTLHEQGITDEVFKVNGWLGMAAPANTPATIIDQVVKATQAILQKPDVQERLLSFGLLIKASTPDEFQSLYDSEFDLWRTMFENSGASVIG